MDIGSKIELIQIFSQLAEIRCARWLCQLTDRAELFKIVLTEICTRLG